MVQLEKVKAQLDVTFYAELNLAATLTRGLSADQRMAFLRSFERMKGMWKLRDQYESAK